MTPPWCESKGHYSWDSTGLHTRRCSRPPVGVESTLLEVLEPPIVPPGFERGKTLGMRNRAARLLCPISSKEVEGSRRNLPVVLDCPLDGW
jgi:hypothetical protein